MKLESEFNSVDIKPKHFKGTHYSDDLVVLDKNNDWFFAHYDFEYNIWEDLTVYSELYGHPEIEDVILWTEINIVNAK